MSRPIVEVRDLHRAFGAYHAVHGITFDVLEGQVVGFIGANGAGKTTTMRILATLDLPTSGIVKIDGYDVVDFPAEVRPKIGWMPDSFGMYENVTVWEYLDFYARAYDLRGAKRRQRVDEVMAFTDLIVIAHQYMNTLSKGMGQRLCLGRTLLSDPSFLILDEPAAGLDPKARIEFKNLIRLLSAQGKTIFISSHILSELDEMCDTLLFIDHGKIVHHGETAGLKRASNAAMVVNVEILGEPLAFFEWVSVHPGARLIDRHRRGGRLAFDEATPELVSHYLKRMVQDGLPVVEFHREERRLEDAFVDILKGSKPPVPGTASAAVLPDAPPPLPLPPESPPP
jgi:ABC-2 type transport system ATP-binding protein